ncbi:MAG: signal peptidase I [Fuerstiella sp.]
MSVKKTKESSEAAEPRTGSKKKKSGDGVRETVESIAIAFVLAFLFKTFQAEAYVIPTGSMAPTLYGRHKDVTCDGCGFRFALGASSEINQESGALQRRIETAVCSNCGKEIAVSNAAVFNGDRILVNKQISEYKRFDVVVFKNPEQGHVNYIKRLVGLPDETLRIRKGDLWVRTPDDEAFRITRKDPYVQKDIQLTVHDDRYPATPLLEVGWPERWEPSVESSDSGSVGGWLAAANDWTVDSDARAYTCETRSGDLQWLRYRHFQPDAADWRRLENGFEPARPAARLIADFCSFNAADVGRSGSMYPGSLYWVGDLTINAEVEVREVGDGGRLDLELVEGPQTFRCTFDLATGEATVRVMNSADPGDSEVMATAGTSLQGEGSWEVSFANVDDRICLWVDGTLIEFDQTLEYEASDVPQPGQHDLAPCGIAVSSASATVSGLLLERDIYYRNDIIAFDHRDGVSIVPSWHNNVQHGEVPDPGSLASLLDNPEAWAATYAEQTAIQLQAYGRFGEYQLAGDEYLMFGDNSSMSKDSRLFDFQARPLNGVFSHRYAVREQDLIGKALYIFWPHGVPFLNGGEGIAVRYHSGPKSTDPGKYPSVRVPFYPNISRMKKIR